MIIPPFQIGRRLIQFSRHAEDRYCERAGGRPTNRQALVADFTAARWSRSAPGWVSLSQWHRARMEGCLVLDDDRAFIVSRMETGDLVAVTFVVRRDRHPAGDANRAPSEPRRAA